MRLDRSWLFSSAFFLAFFSSKISLAPWVTALAFILGWGMFYIIFVPGVGVGLELEMSCELGWLRANIGG